MTSGRWDRELGGEETEGLVKPTNEIKVLHRLSSSSFANIVLGAQEDQLASGFIQRPADIDKVGPRDVFGVRRVVSAQQADERGMIQRAMQTGLHFFHRQSGCRAAKDGGGDAHMDGHQMRDK